MEKEKAVHSTNHYLTMEEKMDVLKKGIFEAIYDKFINDHSDDEIDRMIDDYTIEDNIYNQTIWVNGYENRTFNEMNSMTYDDLITLYNGVLRGTLTFESLENMKLYWEPLTKEEKCPLLILKSDDRNIRCSDIFMHIPTKASNYYV